MGYVTGEMFIGDHVLLNVDFAAARTRLGNLAGGGLLLGACVCPCVPLQRNTGESNPGGQR
jgi:hypothetical protein